MIKRSGHGKSVDWYLLGVLLYEMVVGMPPYYATNKDQLYSNIQNGPLKLPSYLSDNARDILVQLLNRNPYKRLGSGKRGAQDIKDHPFFSDLNWTDAANRKLQVPKPYIKKVMKQDIDLDKIYGKNALDATMKQKNKVREWTFIEAGPNAQKTNAK